MFDCQFSELVTITVEFAVAFATLFVENEHLFAFYERRDDFANHFGSFYYGSAHGDVTFVVYQQYFLKFWPPSAAGMWLTKSFLPSSALNC